MLTVNRAEAGVQIGVGAVVDDLDKFQADDERQSSYSGLVGLQNTVGLTPIGRGVSVVIYRVADCKS